MALAKTKPQAERPGKAPLPPTFEPRHTTTSNDHFKPSVPFPQLLLAWQMIVLAFNDQVFNTLNSAANDRGLERSLKRYLPRASR